MELLYTNHRLTTHDVNGLNIALDWFDKAINLPVKVSGINALNKEYLVLGAMLLVLFAMIPLMNILLGLYLFSDVVRKQKEMPEGRNRRFVPVLITVLLSGLSYPFMTQLGHGLLPLPENIFRMTVGNGFITWYLLLIVFMLISSLIIRIRNKKNDIKNDKFNLPVFIGSFLLAGFMVGFVYLVNFIYYKVFNLDLRFIWPFFRPFNLMRLGQYFVYLPFFIVFYMMNQKKVMKDMWVRSY